MRARPAWLALLLTLAIAADAAAAAKVLTVWTAERGPDGRSWCTNCDRFWHQANTDPEFAATLKRHFDVRYRYVNQGFDGLAAIHGIRKLPTFAVAGGPVVEGYTNKADLLERLQIATAYEPPAEMNRPVTRTAAGCNCQQHIAGFTEQLGALAGRVDALEKTMRTMAANQELLRDHLNKDENGHRLQDLALRVDALEQRPAAAPAKQDPPPAAPPPSSGFSWWKLLPTVATAAGFSTPIGAGLMGAGWLISRVIRRRRDRRAGSSQRPSPPPDPLTVDSPPQPQQVVTETRFAPYERDTYSQAMSWAQAELARKYPNAVATVDILNSLVEQYLKRKPATP